MSTLPTSHWLPGMAGQLDPRISLYFACKLTGETRERLAAKKGLIDKLAQHFRILPFAFDFERNCPLGNVNDVLRDDLCKVRHAEIMVVLLWHDASDGRGMEVMHRLHTHSASDRNILILAPEDRKFTPFYLGLDREFGGVDIVHFDPSSLDGLAQKVIDWARVLPGIEPDRLVARN